MFHVLAARVEINGFRHEVVPNSGSIPLRNFDFELKYERVQRLGFLYTRSNQNSVT
jgi:hypothetical protein